MNEKRVDPISQSQILPELQTKWTEGVASEIHFWRRWVKEKGDAWKEDYAARLDVNRPFNKTLENCFRFMPYQEIEILDVGAGPITTLGYSSEKFKIKITATDALADEYAALLDDAGLNPPVRTLKCAAEDLKRYFGSRRFHVCHSRNALDSCLDPRKVIRQMVEQLFPNGLMYIEVYRNEGEKAKYVGLHSWNFDSDNEGNFILWRGDEKFNISKDVSDFGEIQLHEFNRILIFTLYRNRV